MLDNDKYKKRIERERLARKEAERLLEEKSAALYEKNMELFALSESLEKLVAQRTAQMQNARDEALAALKVKTDFIANMSHELRTPMNGVLGVLSLMQNEQLSPEQTELLGVAESSGKHLLGVINDILDFSKIEANKISIELAPVEIRPYIKETITPFVLQAKNKGLAVNYAIDENVESMLNTDKLRLTQIITNLLSNALKFTHQGEVKLTLSKLDDSKHRLVVCDTGIGISPENLNMVFAAFEQADTSITREFGGTGLGMNITKRLVDMLDGNIHVESKLGEGTSFIIDMHMQAAQIDLNLVATPCALKHTNKKLLVVEDHNVNQMVAQRLLESWGFDIVLAENGLEATQIAKQQSFDAVLMDLQMPIMGGVEATKILRKEYLIDADVPIIAMTAHSSQEHIKECLQAGMQDHISKPLDKDRLLSVLNTYLSADIAVTSESELPSAVSADINIVHVEIAQSLARVGGDWPLLHSLIQRFLHEFDDFFTLFSQIKADGMSQMAVSMLHKIKGSGGNLGMTTLAELAGHHENRLLQSDTWPSENEIHNISQMILEIKGEFLALEEPKHQASEKQKVKVSKETLLTQISLVEEGIKQDVFAAEAALNELLRFDVEPKLSKVLNTAELAMQNFHTEAVLNALTQAQQMLE
ncbi:response regulator [Glaciecola sp. SC05]|uniref:response regulator n=1 Tax=Glaciecola sp. SC05 TaxID=1987355 RepID=UPI0035274339